MSFAADLGLHTRGYTRGVIHEVLLYALAHFLLQMYELHLLCKTWLLFIAMVYCPFCQN